VAVANIIQQQQDLEYFPDEQLMSEAQQPSGRFPGYLVITEVERRQQFRDRYNASQQAQEGEQPSIMEQAVEEFSGGIPSADPNFQGQPPMPPGPQMAGGGKVPRYQAGLFVDPLTGKSLTADDIRIMQGLLKEDRRGALFGSIPGLESRDVSELSQADIDTIANRFRKRPGVGSSVSNWAQQLFTPSRPFAESGTGVGVQASREHRLREMYSDLPGQPLPTIIRESPRLQQKFEEFNEDPVAWMDWATTDPEAKSLISSQLDMAPDRVTGLSTAPVDPAEASVRQSAIGPEVDADDSQQGIGSLPDVNALRDIREGYEEVADISKKFGVEPPDTEGLGQLYEDYRTKETGRIEREREWLEKNTPPSLDPTVTEHNKRRLEDAIRLAEEGSPAQQMYEDRLEDLERDDNSRAAYRQSLDEGIASLSTRDKDLIGELKSLKVGEEEMTGNIRSMGYGAIGAAILNIGIDNDKASQALSDGITDVRKYRRAVKMDNVEVEAKLNNLDRERYRDERELNAAIVSADDSLYNEKADAIANKTNEKARLDAEVTNIGETMHRIGTLQHQAELGNRKAADELGQAENALILNEADQKKALQEMDLKYGAALLDTAYKMIKLDGEAQAALTAAERNDIARLGHIVDGIKAGLQETSDPNVIAGLLSQLSNAIARLGELGSGMGGRSMGQQAQQSQAVGGTGATLQPGT
jgi:hypothetical protein